MLQDQVRQMDALKSELAKKASEIDFLQQSIDFNDKERTEATQKAEKDMRAALEEARSYLESELAKRDAEWQARMMKETDRIKRDTDAHWQTIMKSMKADLMSQRLDAAEEAHQKQTTSLQAEITRLNNLGVIIAGLNWTNRQQ
jgi:hypothetical protein